MTGREALLNAFDRVFESAASKLNVVCTPEERAVAKEAFAERCESALEWAARVEVPELPEEVVGEMEAAIDRLSPADLAGLIASVPLARQTQEMLRTIAYQQAEQRLVEHFAAQADTRFGH